jgi:outer membrane protein TolC
LAANNPLILASINKQSVFEIEQKLKREKLKPKLKVKYNPLISTSSNSVAPSYSFYDYTWGFDFSMSLFLRSERAGIQKGEIKLQEIDLDIQDKRNELKNKIENSLQQQAILIEQVSVFEQNVKGYKQLLEGENEEFKYGESSVFLLNQRQEKYINGQLKLIEMKIKLQRERLNYLYYSNKLVG